MLRTSLQIDTKTSHKIGVLAKSKDRSKAQEIRELVNDELRRLEMGKITKNVHSSRSENSVASTLPVQEGVA